MPTIIFFIIFIVLLIVCLRILSRLTQINNRMEEFLSSRRQAELESPYQQQLDMSTTKQPQDVEASSAESSGDSTPVPLPHPASSESEEDASTPVPVSTDEPSGAKLSEQSQEIDDRGPEPSCSGELIHSVQDLLTTPEDKKKRMESLELRIGIQWAIIVGSITLLVGLIFLARSAFGTFFATPGGKVTVISLTGMAALLVGEFTRRRNYGFAAKALTALGFAILYISVFSAYAYFDLLAAAPAFALAICITLAAMGYAVYLDEVVMAFLALFGGFLSPVMLSINQNRPHALFIYVSILSLGTMACSVFRKWRSVNILSFIGAFLLYTAWYAKYYTPEQMGVAIAWLAGFFFIFLAVPILYELVKKTATHKEAAILVLLNALFVFSYLLAMLYQEHRQYLAAAAVIIAMAYLFMTLAVTARCPRDANLPPVMLAIAMFCLTIAIPLYFNMYSAVMAFVAEAVILTLIAAKYRSITTQIFSFLGLGLAACWLLDQLPMHTDSFRFILNPACLSWCAIATALYLLHLIYRRIHFENAKIIYHPNLPLFYYLCFLGALIITAAMEWHYHLEINLRLSHGDAYVEYVLKAVLVIITASVILLVIRPFSPKGLLCKQLGTCFTVAGSLLAPIALVQFHRSVFTIFFNADFLLVFVFVLGLFAAAVMLRSQRKEMPRSVFFSNVLAMMAVFVLWLLLTEEIYLYWNRLAERTADPKHYPFLGQMFISIMWAIYATCLITIGLWRKISLLRYVSLSLYILVLVKVFIFDMGTRMSGTYRIAGFVVLGLALIGVSYLYQFCKNKGVFQDKRSEEPKEETVSDEG